MTQAPPLQKGDKVAIVAPAGRISYDYVFTGKTILESWDLQVVVGEYARGDNYHQYAGTDEQRQSDLQKHIDDKEIKAIFFARGGYGSVRIIDKLNFNALKESPKWLIGFSDITIFHSFINKKLGIDTIHGPMPVSFSPANSNDFSLTRLQNLLFGVNSNAFSYEKHALNQMGTATGELVGGNLSILYSLRGTDFEYNYENKILFIEEVGEYLYHLDRMMNNLYHGKILEKVNGIIVGYLTHMKDNDYGFGKSAEEIISEYTSRFSIPVAFGFPGGHEKPNYALQIGRQLKMLVNENESKIIWF